MSIRGFATGIEESYNLVVRLYGRTSLLHDYLSLRAKNIEPRLTSGVFYCLEFGFSGIPIFAERKKSGKAKSPLKFP